VTEPKRNDSKTAQPVRFEDAARALGCDESEERFDAALKKVAAHKPPKDSETGFPKAKQSKDAR
jgi:hypothetical protein